MFLAILMVGIVAVESWIYCPGNILAMLRRTLAVSLMVLCLPLSGFHILEELSLYSDVAGYSSTQVPVPDVGQSGRLLNSIVECADRSRIRRYGGLDGSIGTLPADTHTFPVTKFRLHRLHCVLLI